MKVLNFLFVGLVALASGFSCYISLTGETGLMRSPVFFGPVVLAFILAIMIGFKEDWKRCCWWARWSLLTAMLMGIMGIVLLIFIFLFGSYAHATVNLAPPEPDLETCFCEIIFTEEDAFIRCTCVDNKGGHAQRIMSIKSNILQQQRQEEFDPAVDGG